MLNNLSVNHLYNSLVTLQITPSREFAIVANKETLDTLDKFSEALGMPDSGKRILWKIPCIENTDPFTKIKPGHIIWACQHIDCETIIHIDHYKIALKHIVEYDPKAKRQNYSIKLIEDDIWGLDVNLN